MLISIVVNIIIITIIIDTSIYFYREHKISRKDTRASFIYSKFKLQNALFLIGVLNKKDEIWNIRNM